MTTFQRTGVSLASKVSFNLARFRSSPCLIGLDFMSICRCSSPTAYCYDDMDGIPGLTVTRYDSSDLNTPISPETPWKSVGETGPSFIMVFSEATQINQLEFKTESGGKVRVVIRVSTNPDPTSFDRDLFGGAPVDVNSGERLDIPSPPAVTNVYVIQITFITTESQTVKVFGCTVPGKVEHKSLDFPMWNGSVCLRLDWGHGLWEQIPHAWVPMARNFARVTI